MDRLLFQLEQNPRGAGEFCEAWAALYAQFERTGIPDYLEKAIENIQGALSLTSDGHPDRPKYLNNLGMSFQGRFECTGMLDDLDEAIKVLRQAVSLTPNEHPNRPGCLSNLGISFESRFRRTGVLSDLKEAAENLRQAVSLTPNDHPNKPMYLSNLGNSFESRSRLTGKLSYLEAAIKCQRQAVSLIPDDHPDKPGYLNNLGVSFQGRFTRTGMLSDLDEAIKSLRRAISLTPNGHPNKPECLSNLGISFASRFRRTGILNDLEEAIKSLRQAISLTPDDHPAKPMYLDNLGISLQSHFRRTGMLRNLDEAIKNQRQAVSLIPNDHSSKPICLNNMGASFKSRFERTGTLSDLEEAITSLHQAVSLIPDGHPNKPIYLNNLGDSLKKRFEHTGAMSDLDEATKNLRQAASLTPDDHPDKPGRLNNLGSSFQSRFKHTGVLSDLEEAIKSKRQAVSLTPDDHPSKPGFLNNLGISLDTRFGRTGMLSDIKEAIDNQRQAVSFTPDNHPDKSMFLNVLGIFFQSRFKHTRMLSDLEEAIKTKRQALTLIPDDHPNRPLYLMQLGVSFESRFQQTELPNDLDNAISNLRLAATSNLGQILPQCQASQLWARLEAKRNPPSALIAYSQAISLLPRVAWIGDPIDTRHSQLTTFGYIPREAAAFALDVDRPDLALEWLEQGRSVVWNQLLLLRPSLDNLHQAHPDLRARFIQISQELRSAATRGHNRTTPDSINNPISLEEKTQQHHRLAEKWDSLVEEIRSLPNFQDFLLPKKVSTLMEAASLGPVVVINVHQRRCDALVLDRGRDQVLHIPLKNLHYDDLTKMYTSLRQYLANPGLARRWEETRAGRQAKAMDNGSLIIEILEKIYSKVVHPILQALDMTTPRSDSSQLPRIWWCPTGLLTFFPLHAACHTTGTKIDGTFNYAVSSYTPTINALLEARSTRPQLFNQLVGIAMTHTPGQSKLPGAGAEIAKIQKLFASDSRWSFEILRNEQATSEQVMTRMQNHSWIHLACHATQDKKEPTQSGFWLHDRRLTITDIVAKPFGQADLAFLSACQTAAGDENASDEAVHITGAMLGTGYRNVIGTMWSIPDEAASRVATKVYEALLFGGEPDSSGAAQALHDAVRELRESDHDLYTFWVPFVHYGA